MSAMALGSTLKSAVAALAAAALLSGCGGGEVVLVWGRVAFFGSDPHTSNVGLITIGGSSFVPFGAQCTPFNSPFAPPSCNCVPGPLVTGHWTNGVTGGSGSLVFQIIANDSCVPVEAVWQTSPVGLQPGLNPISVTIRDGRTEGAATANFQRQ